MLTLCDAFHWSPPTLSLLTSSQASSLAISHLDASLWTIFDGGDHHHHDGGDDRHDDDNYDDDNDDDEKIQAVWRYMKWIMELI